MATTCTASGTIAEGDAVCVVGFDSGTYPLRPILVARASRANLATSKTVFGVARSSGPIADGGTVDVNVAGEMTEAGIATGLAAGAGAGTSRIIATDITQDDANTHLQCRLIRVDRPDGSEHVVGTCDENGHLSVQPRATHETSAQHVFNVNAYGAVGDGVVDDRNAIQAAADAAAVVSGRLFLPPGVYAPASDLAIASNVQVLFDEGASLEPNAAKAQIGGRVSCHAHQRVFGGTGYSTAPAIVAGAFPAISISGDPVMEATINIRIVSSGMLATPMTFQFSSNHIDGKTLALVSGVLAREDRDSLGSYLVV